MRHLEESEKKTKKKKRKRKIRFLNMAQVDVFPQKETSNFQDTEV